MAATYPHPVRLTGVRVPAPLFFERTEYGLPQEQSVRCGLCHHRCTLGSTKTGVCMVRGGEETLPFYGRVSSTAIDPIEKKPLFHYRPGSAILSVGFVGCNLRCPFCQNWQISRQTSTAGGFVSPEKLISMTLDSGLNQIAYTYSEPLVHAEYLLDCMAFARSNGISNVLVTNGCISDKAASKIIPLADAANIDLKCFSASSYKNILGGSLPYVKNFIKAASENIHTEITTLIIPDFNDSIQEIDQCIDFIASLSESIPWHISAYHPAYKWNRPSTKRGAVLGIKKRARQKLLYCYAGNINDDDNDTICLCCGAVLVKRNGYRIKTDGLFKKGPEDNAYYCGQCGAVTVLRT
jgi:pyruvate formate lyase activating enzyme